MSLASAAVGHAQAPDRTFLAVPIAVRAPSLSETFVKAYHDGALFWVDVAALMELVGYTVHVDGLVLTAMDATRRFRLDYKARQATVGDAPPVFLWSELQHSDDLFLLAVGGLKKVFGDDVTWDAAGLALRLSTAAEHFETAALGARRFLGGEAPGPLRFGLERRMLGGGVVSWHATSQWYRGRPLHNRASASYTLSALGGAVQGGVGTSGQTPSVSYTIVRPASLLLTRLELGTQVVQGGTRTEGVRVSNQPLVSPHVQRTGTVRGLAEPHSVVEVLAGGQVTDRAQADALGRYQLRVPAYYGTTEAVVRVRPLGGLPSYERREYVLTTPALALHRRLYYDAAYGPGEAVARVRYGITPRMTARAAGGSEGPYQLGLTGSPLSSIVLSASAGWPLHLAAASGQLWRPGLRVHANYVSADDSRSAQLGASGQWRRWSGQLTGSSSQVEGAPPSRQLSPALAYTGRGGISLRHQLQFTDRDGAFQTSWRSALGYTRSAWDAGLRLSLFARGAQKVTTGGQLLVSFRQAFLGVTAEYTPALRALAGYVTLQLRTPAGSLRSRMDSHGGHTHSGYGSVSVGPGIRFSDGALDDTGALVRVFDDRNRNGRRDAGDPILDDVAVQVWHATQSRRGDGAVRVSHLSPYTTYQVELVEQTIHDPLLRPATGYTFSFMADPGHTKHIDVPLQRLPLVRGHIQTGGLAPARLRVEVLRGAETVSSTPVYSDGGFVLRLEGGHYELRVVDVVDGVVLRAQPLDVPRSSGALDVDVILSASDQ